MYIKRVDIKSSELKIAEGLQTLPHEPQNHCVPILKILKPADDSSDLEAPVNLEDAFIVMPFLRNIDDPPFETVRDIIDMVDQLLEVSQFSVLPARPPAHDL